MSLLSGRKRRGPLPEQFLTALVASADDAIIGETLDGVVLSWNAAAERLYGYKAAEMIGRSLLPLFPEERAGECSGLLDQVRRDITVRHLDSERLRKDGSRVQVTLTVSPVLGPDGTVVGASSIARDRTEMVRLNEAMRQAEKEAAESLSILDTLQSSAPVGFSFVDQDFRFVRVNEKAAAINGVSVRDHLGRTMAEVIPQFWPQLEASYRGVLARGEPILNVEVASETAEDPGRLHFWLESLYPIRVDGEIIGVGAIFVDVTDLKEAEQTQSDLTNELRYQALHDSLTGLPNRTLILDRAEQMLARGRRNNLATGALFIDLDNFKDINDTLGHRVGDQLLVELARRLTSELRETDTVGRLGGDEFVVLTESLPAVGGSEAAGQLEEGTSADIVSTSVAERILQLLREPFALGDSQSLHTVTASIGIATGPRPTAEELLRDADVALYEAKAAGKKRYVLFQPQMRQAVENHVELQMDLSSAVERDEFFLAYQPIFEIDTCAVVGVEALLRWQHPIRGMVMPDEFIPMLEESGLILTVGRQVLLRACQQAAEWHRAGYDLSMSVNVSPRQLDSPGVVSDITAALETSGLDPRHLVVEITESTLMRDPASTVERISQLKALGISVAVDDFGTGYSSLAYLRRFPVDILKIDRTFIASMASSERSSALIHTLVQLGKSLGLDTVAEGIEEQEQLEQLRDEQCDTGQGLLYAKPLSPRELEIFLRTHSVAHSDAESDSSST
jgi:diguanylate cyclase (GGDEF)-like protein/PAS domain S-box-containing protein